MCPWLFIVYIIGRSEVFGKTNTEIVIDKDNFNVRLSGYTFFELKDKSLHDCVRECAPLVRCKSFNYDHANRVCELNDAVRKEVSSDKTLKANRFIYSDISAWTKATLRSCAENTCTSNQKCLQDKTTDNTCISTDCDGKLPPGFTFRDTESVSLGSVRTYKFDCPPGKVCVHNMTCGLYQKWSKMENTCREIRNCYDVKLCNPTYSDGEYWIYPETFGGKKVKIYCHAMGTSTPREYVTVKPTDNVSRYSDSRGYTDTKFYKIRVNLEEMNIIRYDFTFAIVNNHNRLPYAYVTSCGNMYAIISISTEGTGFKFSDSLSLTCKGIAINGWTRNEDSTKFSTSIAGGNCGTCFPSGALYLFYDDDAVVDEGSAVLSKC